MSNAKHHDGNCVKCGIWRASLHRDHIVPKCKGGSDEDINTQYLCGNCHEDKSRIDMKGIPKSAATRAKISESHKGKKLTHEHRIAIGNASRGRVTSEEIRVKQRAAAKASWTPERKRRHAENRLRRAELELADLKRQLAEEESADGTE